MTSPGPETTGPDFTTTNQHGEQVSLAALRGTPTVLVFYPFAFTGVCTGEMAALQENLSQFDALGAKVLAISCDTMYSLRVFGDREGLTFDLLSDYWPHGKIASAYGVFDTGRGCARRASFVLDAEQRITWSVINEAGEPRAIADHLAAVTSATA